MTAPPSIPLAESVYDDLEGTATFAGSCSVRGRLFFTDGVWHFRGEVSPDTTGTYPAPYVQEEFGLDLRDSSGRRYDCRRCLAITPDPEMFLAQVNAGLSITFVAIVGEATVTNGTLEESDAVTAYGVLYCEEFRGLPHGSGNWTYETPASYIVEGASLFALPVAEFADSGGFYAIPNSFSNAGEVLEVENKLCFLMSFAEGNRVGCPYTLIWKDDANYTVRLKSRGPRAAPGRGIFQVGYPGRLGDYLSRAWPKWDAHPGLNLPVLIDWYVLALQQDFTASKMLVASVWMEAIKHQYASRVKG